jgi:hypothetical protein
MRYQRNTPRQSVGGGKLFQNRLRSRFLFLKITVLRGKLTFGDPLLDSGVAGYEISEGDRL